MTKPTCPYCGKLAELVDSSVVYRRSHGNIWICYPCDAWVGVHRDDGLNRPLGRLANAALREWKQRAHAAFDTLWQRKMTKDKCSKSHARKTGYLWLADQLGINFRECHIGLFDEAQCRKVVEACSPENLKIIALSRELGLPHDTVGPGEEEEEPCRCWIERQGDDFVMMTVVDERTPGVCSQAAGRIVKRR